MQKFKKLFLLTLLLLPLLTACGNKDVLGLTYTFDHATVKLPEGTIVLYHRNSIRDNTVGVFHSIEPSKMTLG